MAAHDQLILLTGPQECFDRECEEYATRDGQDDPSVERCSHIKDEVVCATCSIESEGGTYEVTFPWPCERR